MERNCCLSYFNAFRAILIIALLPFAVSCTGEVSGEIGSGSSFPLLASVSDGDYYDSLTQTPTLSWAAAPTSASIDSYEIAIGSSAGASDVYTWTNVGAVTSTSVSGLGLSHGSSYYLSVRGVSNGEVSGTLSADGWTVDNVDPNPAAAADDGVNQPVLTQTNMITWTAGSDADSGIAHYEVSIGLTAGAADVVGWTPVGNVTSYQFTGMSFTSGTTYYVSVQAVDQAGNTSAVTDSDGFIAGEYCSDKAAWLTYNASGNAGTPADPFEICNAEQLADIGTGATELSSSYILMGDIDLAPYYAVPNPEFQIGDCQPAGCAGWNGANQFTGDFDGNGKTISNFSFVSPATIGSSFIASITGSSVVKDLTLATATVSGASNVGILTGSIMDGKVNNVDVDGSVTSAGGSSAGLVGSIFNASINQSSANVTLNASGQQVGGILGSGYHAAITNSTSSGSITNNSQMTGGIVGLAQHTTVSNSKSDMSVTNTNTRTGGIAGRTDHGRISNSYNTGTVSGFNQTGGVVGSHDYNSTVINSYNSGSVISTGSDVGGLIGNMYTTTYLTNSYSVGSVNSTGGSSANVGFLVGQNTGTVANSYYLSSAVCDSTGAGGACGTLGTSKATLSYFYSFSNAPMDEWDSTSSASTGTNYIWGFPGGALQELWFEEDPTFTVFFAGDGTEASPYLITSESDFNLINQNPRWMHNHFELTGNLDFTANPYNQVGGLEMPFLGHFDGGGFTISNINNVQASTDYVGAFGIVAPQADLDNLTVNNVTIEGRNYVGGIAAVLDGTNANSLHVGTGTVTGNGNFVGGVTGFLVKCSMSNFSSSATVSGVDYVGGALGFAEYCNTNNGFAKGNVSGVNDVGGIIGRNRSNLNRAYAQGNVTASGDRVGGFIGYNDSNVDGAYSSGSVVGVGFVGGFIGEINGTPNITNSFAAAPSVDGVNGVTEVGLLIGVDSGGATLTNMHYWSGATCDSTGAAGVCNAFGAAQPTLTNFYNPVKAPLSSWNFVWDWSTTVSFPKLIWEP